MMTGEERVSFPKEDLEKHLGKGTMNGWACPDAIKFKDGNIVLVYDNSHSGLPSEEIVLRGKTISKDWEIEFYKMKEIYYELRAKTDHLFNDRNEFIDKSNERRGK
jgi:hypothetical protein